MSKIEVIRGGKRVEISIYDIVVGDVIPLKIGDQVPADGIVISGHSLSVDESSMTGEAKIKLRNGTTPSRGDMFIRTHTRSNAEPTDERSKAYIDEMNHLAAIEEGGTSNSINDAIYNQVMPPERHGRVRGFGPGVTPTRLFGSSSRQTHGTAATQLESMRLHVDNLLQTQESQKRELDDYQQRDKERAAEMEVYQQRDKDRAAEMEALKLRDVERAKEMEQMRKLLQRMIPDQR